MTEGSFNVSWIADILLCFLLRTDDVSFTRRNLNSSLKDVSIAAWRELKFCVFSFMNEIFSNLSVADRSKNGHLILVLSISSQSFLWDGRSLVVALLLIIHSLSKSEVSKAEFASVSSLFSGLSS